ncbi:MAG: copper chaperone PCu(A)C [Yaniella sp.]|uniref:copper chaperone PCu(A)C n=1 Tax=Yaniella sp. TaxID=2773929 RepID=UPI002648888B|nr:copper chaperone PCu(A)C [Yaniella sp.]MDN5818371.1 copper chaperone PCu(A)C [Yaniella sp.]MDN5912617.1 copper chaperone PCu(A)C [Yaniella sp.]MDN6411248.1 copper chaperone PCu(A)C [Yaniella sp.]
MKKVIPLISATALAGLVLTGCDAAAENDVSDETEQAAEGQIFAVEDPWVKATEESLDESSDHSMTSAFAHLTNVSGKDQTIVGASAGMADIVELHEVIDDGGVNVMQEKEGGFPVAADELYELNPGEDHIMLMELTEDIHPGDVFEITLELENGETQDIEFTAKEFVGAQENYGDVDHHDDDH